MARLARVVVPNLPHHVIQRGNRRQQTFFRENDYQFYLDLLAEWCPKFGVEIWAYCLMPNHVHLILVPKTSNSLRQAVGRVHQRYCRHINSRENWRGHLWQGRFVSFPMDQRYLLTAARYIELNPVRAGIINEPDRYRWSSAAAHLLERSDKVVAVQPLLSMMPDWKNFLKTPIDRGAADKIRSHEHNGMPLGDENFIPMIEKILDRRLQKGTQIENLTGQLVTTKSLTATK